MKPIRRWPSRKSCKHLNRDVRAPTTASHKNTSYVPTFRRVPVELADTPQNMNIKHKHMTNIRRSGEFDPALDMLVSPRLMRLYRDNGSRHSATSTLMVIHDVVLQQISNKLQ